MVTADEVDEFLDQIPEHVVVVLDEAYYEFAADFAQPDRANAAKRAARRNRKGTSFTVVRLSRRCFTRRNKVMNFARVPIAPVFENQTLIPEIGGSPSCAWNRCSTRLP